MIEIKHVGNFEITDSFLRRLLKRDVKSILKKYGEKGVDALSKATPKDTGRTASSWEYEITGSKDNYSIEWSNTNTNKGVNIALILQMGHGTGTGGYVKGIDYINPALEPIFKELADEAWKEVTSK